MRFRLFLFGFILILSIPTLLMGKNIRTNPDLLPDTVLRKKSDRFYDSVYKKMKRTKMTEVLYSLAFIPPTSDQLSDSVNIRKSDSPFDTLKNKIIRKIHIICLDPFGPNIYDTSAQAITAAGKAGNTLHIKTRPYVIRMNLLIHSGDSIDPVKISDNIRLIKDLSFIDDARFIFSPVNSGNDSVDVTVITKDVWSIGIDIPVITTSRLVGNLYDANFLGLGDRLQFNMSLASRRAPLFRVDGFNYYYTNIAGTFINADIGFTQEDNGDQNIYGSLNRGFITNEARFAGGFSYNLRKDIYTPEDSISKAAWYNDYGFWGGRSFLVNREKHSWRLVIAQSIIWRHFFSRPEITIDKNRGFYDLFRILTGLSFSRNNYYITNYFAEFGKTENIPYGYLFQVTFGPDRTDFYTRWYTGLNLSAGKYFDKFGYLQGYFKTGMFMNGSIMEDAVVKMNIRYFSPLLVSRNSKYRIRNHFELDYRIGFNQRMNNPDYFDVNNKLRIFKINDSESFLVQKSLVANIISITYTPWYLYGFRFGLIGKLQAAMFALKNEVLFQSPVFSSISASIMIKNDNLIFPTFFIGAAYYFNAKGITPFQFFFHSGVDYQIYDFNVSSPYEETLGN